MPLKNFIKENFVLVVGLALPVLLIVLFFVASVLPKAIAVPPQYKMLFIETRYDMNQNQHYPYDADFFVKDGVLKAHVWKVQEQNGINRKKIMAYDGKTQTVLEIPYDLSKISAVQNQADIVLDEFKNMKLDSSNKAPDGYEFEGSGYNSSGMVTDLFGGGYRSSTPRIVKNAIVFKIPNNSNNNYYSNNIQFLGWVIRQ